MMDQQRGKIIFECDACGEVLETDHSDVATAWRTAAKEEWESRKIGQDWVHGCPRCGRPE